jgi:hypothetical protein
MTGHIERELTDPERAILHRAIDTMPVGREQAHAQLAVAKHGGPAHPGTHPCFFITLPDGIGIFGAADRIAVGPASVGPLSSVACLSPLEFR